jgi:Flp pilus assembly protein TadD
VLQLNSGDTGARFQLARMLAEQGNLQDAMVEYHNLLRLEPNNATSHYNLGLILEQKGDLQGALEKYRRGAELDPNGEVGQAARVRQKTLTGESRLVRVGRALRGFISIRRH